ncbi:MAG: GntR family transcriptional regulator [Oscillospiraceae bacterium]|nr:GntR family transcriptional regulator [Oscillospiraceae bacterium]
MIIALDFMSESPIYMQIRNQIVMGIASGRIADGERLPTIRAMANEAGVNMMTVNKAYALLKGEGYIRTERRVGAVACAGGIPDGKAAGRLADSLRLLISEAAHLGLGEAEFMGVCASIFDGMRAGAGARVAGGEAGTDGEAEGGKGCG